MRHIEAGQARRLRRPLVKLGIAVVALGLVHYVILVATYAAASGWNDQCEVLYRNEAAGEPLGSTGVSWRMYSDPGFTCEYQLSDKTEPLTLTKDLTGPRNLAIGITGLVVVTVIYIARRRRDRSTAEGPRPTVLPGEKQT